MLVRAELWPIICENRQMSLADKCFKCIRMDFAAMTTSTPRNIGKWGMHPLYQNRYHSWVELEGAIASLSVTTEKGDAFEQFSYFYFLYYKDLYNIEEVWCDKIRGREIPSSIRNQYKLEKTDFGVDGVSRLAKGELEAWQAKFHSDRSSAPYAELSTFWAEAEHADSRRIIANCTKLPQQSGKKKGHQQTLLDRLLELNEDFFEALYAFANTDKEPSERKAYTPRPYQAKIVQALVNGLETNDRGKLLAACGIGKTLIALWTTEHEKLQTNKVLVLAPSIALVGQTLREWILHRTKPFAYLCVCSDQSIEDDLKLNDDDFDISVSDLDFSVTTNADDVKRWMSDPTNGRQYIFATYHSIDVIVQAMQGLPNYKFDIIIFDEAHRTVGSAGQRFSIALNNDKVPAKKRLFMTATERLINPAIQTRAQSAGQEVFSMEDVNKYGPVLYNYNFGKAIQEGVIADYQIMLVEVSDEWEQQLTKVNNLLAIGAQEGEETYTLTADELLKASFLIKALDEDEISKVVSFHGRRERAIRFSKCLQMLSRQIFAEPPFIDYVLGTQNSAERVERISHFEQAATGVLGNVQVLSEGVDIPLIDSVYFVDPKTSLIELVQAIGRALRKPFGSDGKIAKIIVPVRIPPDVKNLDDVDWDEALLTFHNVIQAMRDQDQKLAEEINEVNYEVSRGRVAKAAGFGGKIRVAVPAMKLPTTINFQDFMDKITLRVAIANANPDGALTGYSFLGKGERQRTYKPDFDILGDYNPDKYLSQLVEPTLARFLDLNAVMERSSLAIGHNNVSHTQKLGLIKEITKNNFRLTTLGRELKEGKRPFLEIFKNQMLLYKLENGLRPYWLLLKILSEVKTLNYIEFLYGPYIVQKLGDEFDIDGVLQRIYDLRAHYPNVLEVTNLGNREKIREELNAFSPVKFSDKEVWSDRTTIGNKFRYCRNSLEAFDCITLATSSAAYKTLICLTPGRHNDLVDMLDKSDPIQAPVKDYYGDWYWNA